MCHEEERRKKNRLSYGVFVDFVAGVLMTEGLVLCGGREVLLIDIIHPGLLPEIMIDKDGWQVMVVPTYIPADGGFGPGFFPFRIVGEAQEKPDDGDEDDGG